MPSGQNPWSQILGVKRQRAKGSLTDLQRRLWRGILIAEAGLDDAMRAADSEEVRRWLYILHQLSGTYLKIVMDADLEQRMRVLEARFAGTNGHLVGPFN
jgi:hypothetical protein